MDKRTMLPTVGIALLACIALMLAVVGGLYAYNTFAASAQAAHAQSTPSSGTDKGPDWTVTPITTGGNSQHIVIVYEQDNPWETGKKSKIMTVYDLRATGTAKVEMYLVATRILEYDGKFPYINDEQTNKKGYEPAELKKSLEKKK
ncbi:MAG: hypothetical protein KF696_00250 [Planctomycetes bacterium]|nr:hypothetical protein [Planctomycetota bacterium]MCW8134631.1 hypothetical protein [Planctomycetota bacterium]